MRVESLNVSYGQVEAVRGLSFEIERGQVVALIGANGAGKTSTLNAITGLVPSRGSIVLDGQSFSGRNTDEIVRRGVSQVPQGRQLFHEMSVGENLEMGAFLRTTAQARKRLEELCERFPLLRERRTQRAGTLSGGEQQMVAIARALMSEPTVLLLDEPCLGLSPIMVKRIASIIRDLNASGITILLAEQNASFACALAHKVIVIENGRLALEGTPDMLRNDDRMRRAYLGL